MRASPAKPGPKSPIQPKLADAFVQRPALLDVMMEQINYLAGHAAEACPDGCADCARLEQVKHWLLAPFC